MKNKNILFRVGSKPTSKLKILVTFIISILIGTFMGYAFNHLIGLNIIIGVIIFIIANALWNVPSIATMNQYWELTDEYLQYNVIDNYLDKIKYVFDIILNREEEFLFKVRLNEIKSINIYWTVNIGVMGYIYYPLRLSIKLKDDSIMVMDALLNESEEFYNSFQYLKTKSIKINDKYDLLDAIGNPKVNITDYINEIRKVKAR